MTRGAPILIVSRNEPTQDAYVAALRRERIAALGVKTCGGAIAMQRHLRLWGVLLDVIAEEDWQGCVLLRRSLPAGVRLVVLTSQVAADGTFRRRARELGCSGFVARHCPPHEVTRVFGRVALGEPWVECV